MSFLPRKVRRLMRRTRNKASYRGNIAIDQTLVVTSGHPSGPDKRTVDYDAAWYVRDNKEPKWGWEALFVIMARNDPRKQGQFPLLILGMAFERAAVGPAHNAVRAATSIQSRGYPAGLAIGDQAFSPNSKPENYQLPMRALGYDLVHSYPEGYTPDQHHYAGARFIWGAWYCPATPQYLIDANAPSSHPPRPGAPPPPTNRPARAPPDSGTSPPPAAHHPATPN